MADVTGRAVRTISQWGDPETATLPDLRQAFALDLLYNEQSGNEPLILGSYANLFARRRAKRPEASGDIMGQALAVTTAIGDLSGVVRSALDPSGPSGQNVTVPERNQVLEAIQNARTRLDEIEAEIRAACPEGGDHV